MRRKGLRNVLRKGVAVAMSVLWLLPSISLQAAWNVAGKGAENVAVAGFPENDWKAEPENCDIDVIEVKLSETVKALKVGEVYQIAAEVLPSDATNQTLSYGIANETVAEVSDTGEVTAKKPGSTRITVSSANGKTATLQLIVNAGVKPPVEVAEIRLSETVKTLKVGETYRLEAEILPLNASNKSLSYTSGDNSVAEVSDIGEVIAKKAGKTWITVSSVSGKAANLQLTVEALEKRIEVQKVLVSTKEMTVGVGEKVQLEAAVYPSGAKDIRLTYQPSNKKVKVNAQGMLTAQKIGTSRVAIRSSNGKRVAVKVTVKKKPGKISLNANDITLRAGKKFQIIPQFSKHTASYQMTYVSNKKSVAVVSKTGKVTAKKKGNAMITVKTYNGKKAVLKIHVK